MQIVLRQVSFLKDGLNYVKLFWRVNDFDAIILVG
jgi:hypothetical protein